MTYESSEPSKTTEIFITDKTSSTTRPASKTSTQCSSIANNSSFSTQSTETGLDRPFTTLRGDPTGTKDVLPLTSTTGRLPLQTVIGNGSNMIRAGFAGMVLRSSFLVVVCFLLTGIVGISL
jgi:hypothetical protein